MTTECEVEIDVKGEAGGRRFSSSLSPSIYGNEPTRLTLLQRKVRRKLEGERGRAKARITATDDFGARKSAGFEFRLKG